MTTMLMEKLQTGDVLEIRTAEQDVITVLVLLATDDALVLDISLGRSIVAATGARVLATMAKLLHDNGGGRGLVSVCTAGGMGVTAILEAP